MTTLKVMTPITFKLPTTEKTPQSLLKLACFVMMLKYSFNVERTHLSKFDQLAILVTKCKCK